MSSCTSGDALCADVAETDISCSECSFDAGTDLCLDFAAEDFSVSDSPDLTLTEVAAFDESCR